MLICFFTPFSSSTPFDVCFPGRSGDFWPEKLENVTPNFLQSQLHFLPRSRPGAGALLLSRGPGGRWRPMGARRASPPRPEPRRAGTARSAAGRRRQSFFCGPEGAARRRRSPCSSAAAGRSFWLPSRCSGACKGPAARSEGQELPWECARTRPGARRPPSAGLGDPSAQRRAEREAAGARWARRGSARPRRRWGCCCARRWGARARPRAAVGAGAGRWGSLPAGRPSARAPLPAAASGTCWTAAAGGWRACPSRSRPGSLGCKYSWCGRGARGRGARQLFPGQLLVRAQASSGAPWGWRRSRRGPRLPPPGPAGRAGGRLARPALPQVGEGREPLTTPAERRPPATGARPGGLDAAGEVVAGGLRALAVLPLRVIRWLP